VTLGREKTQESGRFHCAPCSESVDVKKGEELPHCPNAGQAIADGADLMATLAARRHLPTSGVVFATAMAGASTAVAA